MLRKKTRDRMVEDSYNRYTFNDEASELPQWFVADETKYFRPFVNLTKEEVAIEKDIIKAYNARPSKKVEEAKTYVVNRTFKSSQGLKSGRNVKMVDSRMKKD